MTADTQAWTKGPWSFRTATSRVVELKRPHYECGVANGRGLAIVFLDDSGGDANAHLIAAAPAMYEALEDCVGWLSAFAKGAGDLEAMKDSARYRRYIAALKQARGESP